jgi:hypothetical protein
MFRGSDGHRYVSTAGHCVLPSDGPAIHTWAADGPPAFDGRGRLIGHFAYAKDDDPDDFALIRLNEGVRSSPRMCHFGGPVAIAREHRDMPALLHYYGNGLSVRGGNEVDLTTVPARSAVVRHTLARRFAAAHGVAYFGDSGGPVITEDGRAFGLTVSLLPTGFGITRLPHQLDLAERALGIELSLITAPVE